MEVRPSSPDVWLRLFTQGFPNAVSAPPPVGSECACEVVRLLSPSLIPCLLGTVNACRGGFVFFFFPSRPS